MAILQSTNTNGNVSFKFLEQDENVFLFSISIKRKTYVSATNDYIKFDIDSFPCSKHSFLEFIKELREWANSDFKIIKKSEFYLKKQFSASDYTCGNSLMVIIGDTEIKRSIPDQKEFTLAGELGATKFETSFIIDITGATQFISDFDNETAG